MTSPNSPSTPRHVAIIMDGNNRWAKSRGWAGIRGHRAGAETVRSTIRRAAEQGVEVLTLFAFSSENWKRPANEVSALMELFLLALKREVKKLHRHDIRLSVIGERSRFSNSIQKHIQSAEDMTRGNRGMHVVICANYGGRWDIVQAAQSMAQQVQDGQLTVRDITEDALSAQLSMEDQTKLLTKAVATELQTVEDELSYREVNGQIEYKYTGVFKIDLDDIITGWVQTQ